MALYPVLWVMCRSKSFAVASGLIILGLLGWRGNFGPDTLTYFGRLSWKEYNDVSDYLSLSFVWGLYEDLLSAVGAGDSLLAFNFSNGFFFSLLLLAIFSRPNPNSSRLAFGPIIILDLAGNTLRIGLALLCFSVFKSNWIRLSTLAIHPSIALLLSIEFFRKVPIIAFTILIAFAIALWLMDLWSFFTPLVDQLALYSDYEYGSEYRGLTDILMFSLVVCIYFVIQRKYFHVMIALLLASLAFQLCQYNYAFVRVVKLLFYGFILNNNLFDYGSISRSNFLCSYFIFCVVSIAVFLRMIVKWQI